MFSEVDQECHELRLTATENVSTKQASDWLLALHKVMVHAQNEHFGVFGNFF